MALCEQRNIPSLTYLLHFSLHSHYSKTKNFPIHLIVIKKAFNSSERLERLAQLWNTAGKHNYGLEGIIK